MRTRSGRLRSDTERVDSVPLSPLTVPPIGARGPSVMPGALLRAAEWEQRRETDREASGRACKRVPGRYPGTSLHWSRWLVGLVDRDALRLRLRIRALFHRHR